MKKKKRKSEMSIHIALYFPFTDNCATLTVLTYNCTKLILAWHGLALQCADPSVYKVVAPVHITAAAYQLHFTSQLQHLTGTRVKKAPM